MKMTTIPAMLRAAIFTGAIGVLPQAAMADTSNDVPDHQEAEDRGGAQTTRPPEERTSKAPDHQEAEDRGGAQTTESIEETGAAPDHAEAENRGADNQ